MIGTISHGTMRAQDLVPSFLDALRTISEDPNQAERLIAGAEYQQISASIPAHALEDDDAYWWVERGDSLAFELFNVLEAFAPDYLYFGSHEGDGSDYGFWPAEDVIREDIREGFCIAISDLSEVPADHCGSAYHVNDHGNATMYACNNGVCVELWSLA